MASVEKEVDGVPNPMRNHFQGDSVDDDDLGYKVLEQIAEIPYRMREISKLSVQRLREQYEAETQEQLAGMTWEEKRELMMKKPEEFGERSFVRNWRCIVADAHRKSGHETTSGSKLAICIAVTDDNLKELFMSLPITLYNTWRHRSWVKVFIVDFCVTDKSMVYEWVQYLCSPEEREQVIKVVRPQTKTGKCLLASDLPSLEENFIRNMAVQTAVNTDEFSLYMDLGALQPLHWKVFDNLAPLLTDPSQNPRAVEGLIWWDFISNTCLSTGQVLSQEPDTEEVFYVITHATWLQYEGHTENLFLMGLSERGTNTDSDSLCRQMAEKTQFQTINTTLGMMPTKNKLERARSLDQDGAKQHKLLPLHASGIWPCANSAEAVESEPETMQGVVVQNKIPSWTVKSFKLMNDKTKQQANAQASALRAEAQMDHQPARMQEESAMRLDHKTLQCAAGQLCNLDGTEASPTRDLSKQKQAGQEAVDQNRQRQTLWLKKEGDGANSEEERHSPPPPTRRAEAMQFSRFDSPRQHKERAKPCGRSPCLRSDCIMPPFFLPREDCPALMRRSRGKKIQQDTHRAQPRSILKRS